MAKIDQQRTNDKIDEQEDEDEFVFQEVAGTSNESSNMPNPLSSMSITNTSQSASDQNLPQTFPYPASNTLSYTLSQSQQNADGQEEEEWEEA